MAAIKFPEWVEDEHRGTIDLVCVLMDAVIESTKKDGTNLAANNREDKALRNVIMSLGYSRIDADTLVRMIQA